MATKIIKETIENHRINYEEFLSIVTNNGGCITGTLIYYAVLKAFNINCDFVHNNIDVLVYDSTKNHSINPVESYIMNHKISRILKKHKYKNALYAKKYKLQNGLNINFRLVNKSVEKIIFEDFNIDCCKIIHIKNCTQIFDVNNFIMQKCKAQFHLELMNYEKFNYCYWAKYRCLYEYHNIYRFPFYSDFYKIIKSYVPNIGTFLIQEKHCDTVTSVNVGHMIKIIAKIEKYKKRGMFEIEIID